MTSDSKRDFLLRNLRCAVLRTKLIAEELTMIGGLVRDDLISPELGRDWADQIAPGCLVVVAESIAEVR